ncbi:MAG: maleylacetoacetate isomerase [Porticoccaceae bacterium]
MITLHGYYRSSAAYRVRIALNLKEIEYCTAAVNLLAGEQKSEKYLTLNPQGLLPALELPNGSLITQSPAILEYLEESYPTPSLLPGEPLARAKARALAAAIGCDTHPLNNLRVLKFLTGELGLNETAKNRWYHHWIAETFEAIEKQLADRDFAGGDQPGMADCYLIPQVYNALRFSQPMAAYPNINRITANCESLKAFQQAAPECQPDAPAS